MNKQEQLLSRSNAVLISNYGRLPIVVSQARGSEFFDSSSKRYIDLFPGFGAGGIAGHCHPQVTEAIQAQAATVASHGNWFTSEPQIALAERISREVPGSKIFFCHSGAEAAEAALKLSRKANPNRYKIICFENGFHGRTMGALSLCPESFQIGFEPMLEGAIRLEYNNINAVRDAIDDSTAAVFIEPIQGEGGIWVPDTSYLRELRALCTERGVLLVCDEVWTAPGRTGKFFAWQHAGITPDITTMAKAIGGGLPLAAMVVAPAFVDVLGPGSHGCTMGGNPLCAAAAVAALSVMDTENLIERAAGLGEWCKNYFAESSLECVEDFRGAGLFFGIQLRAGIDSKEIALRCIDRGVFVAGAKHNVLRFAPALNIPQPLLEEGLAIVGAVLREAEKAA